MPRIYSKWQIKPHNDYDKRVLITGPEDVRLFVDTDDVDKDAVMRCVESMVDILNYPGNEVPYITSFIQDLTETERKRVLDSSE